jgi:GNAT superfamily N-acetyltransferase
VRAVFQPVTPDNLNRLLLFQSRLYASEAMAFHPAAAAEWLLSHPEAGAMWLIEAEGQPAGYLVLTVCASLEFQGRFALLDELYIDKPFRSRSLGRQAVEFAAQWARSQGMRALRLEVAHKNTAALALYRQSGFRSHGRDLITRWLD